MSYKISRGRVKQAWATLGQSGLAPESLGDYMTAAAIDGLSATISVWDWRVPLPARTVLKAVERAVFLSFDPGAPADLSAPEEGREWSGKQLADIPRDALLALQIIGLKALDGNLEWEADPEAFLVANE